MAANSPLSGLPSVPLGTLPADCLMMLSVQTSPDVWQSYSCTPAQLVLLLGLTGGSSGGGTAHPTADSGKVTADSTTFSADEI